eukprot:11414101-Karenia_brevis.AAC.1
MPAPIAPLLAQLDGCTATDHIENDREVMTALSIFSSNSDSAWSHWPSDEGLRKMFRGRSKLIGGLKMIIGESKYDHLGLK